MEAKILLVLVFVIGCNGGVMDNVYERMKTTTIGLKRDATNAMSYGRSVVGLETKAPEESQVGLIGGVIQSTREVISSVRNFIFNPEQPDRGIIGNVIDRVRTGVIDITQVLLPARKGEKPVYTETENTELIRESVNKLYHANGTRRVQGKAFKEAVEKLRKKAEELRNEMSTTVKPI